MLVNAGSPRALGVSGFIACRWSIDRAGRLACHREAEGPDDSKPSRRSQPAKAFTKLVEDGSLAWATAPLRGSQTMSLVTAAGPL
jgi:hypothetical protein